VKSSKSHLTRRDQPDYASLVGAATGGDKDAMEQLLVQAQEVAYRFSLLVCGHTEDAEDVMQDALLKTYQHLNRIQEPSSFRTWLYSTVRNACLMKRRRRVGEPAHFVSVEQGHAGPDGESGPLEIAAETPAADQQAIDTWMDRRLRASLSRLPASYRLILVMREMEGLSTREVAAISRISEANVKTRLHRARLMLRRLLEESES
jgi:RNA polymerase sigma-70 factor (ECF subfamily)